jgi:hypothetical protein
MMKPELTDRCARCTCQYGIHTKGETGKCLGGCKDGCAHFVRGDVEVAPLPPASAVSRDFPSQCPRCGAAAYIGFRTVEHEHGGDCQ